MWQMPNHKYRNGAAARKSLESRSRRPLHLRRADAQVRVTSLSAPSVTQCRVVLNDIRPKETSLFSPLPMRVGQQISLTLEEPKRIYVCGKVIDSQEFDCGSPVISERPFPYRIRVALSFENTDDENAFKTFCEELARDFIFTNQAA